MTATPPPKKQGAIRFEAIIPLLIVSGLIALYFALFFDMHLRHGLEYAATQANGAEVNIGKLKTSVWNASVEVDEIALTDPAVPTQNRLQIGAINFRMLWDALLRGKVVINEASIADIQINTPRASAGRVLPVKPGAEGESVGAKTLARIREEFSGNVVGDLAAIAAGTKAREQLTEITGDLQSSALIDALKKSQAEKSQQWQSRLATIPTGEDFAALQRRLANVKTDNLQDITQIQASMQELSSIYHDFDAKVKTVNEARTALTGDIGAFRGSFAEINQSVKDDVRNLQARMHLPSFDTRTLSRALFGMDLFGKVDQAHHYMNQARRYMPVKRENTQALAVQQRSKGHDYAFGRPHSYPSFWLRKALISSRRADGAGDLSGEIREVSTNPALTGSPLLASITGNFPKQGVTGVKAELVIDHTKATPVERLQLNVGSYAVAGRSLVNSPNVELGFAKATGAIKFAAELREDNVAVRLNNQFTRVAFETKAQSDVVREMINASVAGLDEVDIDAQVTGTWSKLDWQLSTNLANALERGMQRYLQGKMNEARDRIEAQVNSKIEAQRNQLYAQQDDVESGVKTRLAKTQQQIDTLHAQLDAARKKLEARKNALLGSQQQKLKEGKDKMLEKLRQGL